MTDTNFDYSFMEEEEWAPAHHLASWITNNIVPSYVLDVGSGPGMYCRALQNHSPAVKVKALDPNPDFADNPYVTNISIFDIEEPPAPLVLCLEVAEHIEFEKSDAIVDKLCDLIAPGGSIIFSAAQPGQPGVGHINCQPKEFWIEKFLAKPDIIRNYIAENSMHLHLRMGWRMLWLSNNGMIFSKKG